jgi:SAM-dependent methyltransferase
VSNQSIPVPPAALAARVGPGPSEDPIEAYEREGAAVRERIERLLPDDWSWDGRRVLDFGCGSARVLRHFLPEAGRGEFWGCDIDAPSIAWIEANLSPPLHCFQNGLHPPLALEDGSFDLVWATSVFTHIDAWSAWLLELHRVLREEGILVATWLGEGMWDALVGEPYREDEVGMTALKHWEEGGAGSWVFHSEWWLREHWGRAFDVVGVARPPRTAVGTPEITHSYIALRKRAGDFSTEDLERLDPAEPREAAGLATSLRLVRAELHALAHQQPVPGPLSYREALSRSPLGGPLRALGGRRRRSD